MSRNRLRSLTEDVPCQTVKLSRFVDRLQRVTAEELIGPRDDVIDVFHDDMLLVRRQTHPGDQVRIKRIGSPLVDLCFDLFPAFRFVCQLR